MRYVSPGLSPSAYKLAVTMLMSLISLVPPPSGHVPVTAAAVTDLLWPHTAPADAVQHLYARAGIGCIEVAVFTLAVNQSVSDITARLVCLRAVERIPGLRNWRVAPLSQ